MKCRMTLAVACMALLPALAAPLQAGQPVPKSPPAEPTRPASDEDADLRRMQATPAQRREELRAAARSAADRIDVRIRELQARFEESTERMTAESRRAAEESLANVRTERSRFAAQLGRLDDRSNTAMGEAKTQLVQSYRDLVAAMERAWTRIKPAGRTVPPPAEDKPDRTDKTGNDGTRPRGGDAR